MNKQLVLSLLWGALVVIAGQAMAETLYVHDHLRLGVRANPDPAEPSIAVVSTGDALTVLAREGDFIRIRTGEGIDGWVSQGYLSAEPPARLQLEQSEGQRSELEARLVTSTSNLEAMENRLAALSEENAALQQQLDTYTTAAARIKRKYAWVYQSAAVIALLAGAFFLGVGWYKHRVRQRLGGMEI